MFKVQLYNCDLHQIPKLAGIVVDVMQNTGIKMCFLAGRIGTGKTTLIKEICKLLGVVNTVNSPSFNIINEYLTLNNTIVYHFDFYRITNIAEALDIGVIDYIENDKAYRFVEWSENILDLLTKEYILIVIDGDNYNDRNYKIEEVRNEI